MLVCVGDLDGLAYGVGFAEEATEFQLDVETAAGAEGGDLWVGGGIEEDLTIWTSDGRS